MFGASFFRRALQTLLFARGDSPSFTRFQLIKRNRYKMSALLVGFRIMDAHFKSKLVDKNFHRMEVRRLTQRDHTASSPILEGNVDRDQTLLL
mmetsp:Transcript_51716/g.60418  ORF Transcript_51716/g.60418 Transcript_51716/m.60418 type:complete len:93 (-) Transcript_51716:528-806(-)